MHLDALPGHHIRRLQQMAVAVFLQETQGFGVTPVQYGALLTVARQPGLDQRTLAGLMGLDTSTTAGVVDRLEARGLLRRSASPTDRRVKLLSPTDEGRTLLADMAPQVDAAQARMLAPLTDAERPQFLGMLTRLVQAHHEAGRWPAEGSGEG
jgi:DNA-binding MarR family transcriptional regulator